jgi:hypothetical protein
VFACVEWTGACDRKALRGKSVLGTSAKSTRRVRYCNILVFWPQLSKKMPMLPNQAQDKQKGKLTDKTIGIPGVGRKIQPAGGPLACLRSGP